MRVYIDSNLGHHLAQGGEDMCDTCPECVAACDERRDCYEDNPNWVRLSQHSADRYWF